MQICRGQQTDFSCWSKLLWSSWRFCCRESHSLSDDVMRKTEAWQPFLLGICLRKSSWILFFCSKSQTRQASYTRVSQSFCSQTPNVLIFSLLSQFWFNSGGKGRKKQPGWGWLHSPTNLKNQGLTSPSVF